MSTVSAPYGFKPLYHRLGGVMRPLRYKDGIASTYGSTIGKGCPIYFLSDGTIALLAAGGASGCDGIFDHCEFTDSSGVRRTLNYWPASTTATNIDVWIWPAQNIVFAVQGAGSVAKTAIGDNADHTAGTVNTRTGLSADYLATGSLAGDGNLAMFKIVGLVEKPNNAWGDTYTEVQVLVNEVGNAFLTTKGSGETAGNAI